jgi:hypothetical protein
MNALNQGIRRTPGNALSRGGMRYGGGPQPQRPQTIMNALMQTPLRTFLEYQAAGVPNKLLNVAQSVGDSYKTAIDNSLRMGPTVMSGTAPPEATDGYNKANLELVADMAGSGAFSEVPKGALRMFGGVSAKTADKAALQQAQELTAKGADRGQVWKETGWYEDVDGQWKFEIDDSGAKLGPEFGDDLYNSIKGYGIKYDAPAPLEKVIPHQELADAYGGRGITFGTQDRLGGSYIEGGRNVFIGPDGNKSVGLHELQHDIQGAEGFARGGNPETARDTVANDYYSRASQYRPDKAMYDSHNDDRIAFMQADYNTKLDDLSKAENPKPSMVTNMSDWYQYSTEIRDTIGIQPKKAGPARDEWVRGAAAFLRNKHLEELNGSFSNSQMNKFNSVIGDRKQAKAAALKAGRKMEKLQPAADKTRELDKRRNELNKRTDFELYQRLAGEAEARNVQTRMDYTPEQRRATPPWETLDVPEDELIVRMK